MKKHNTQLALPLLVALITLQSTQAADIIVDDFSSTSVTADSQRLTDGDIDQGWDATKSTATIDASEWTVAGGFLSNSSAVANNTASEGAVAQMVSSGADANGSVTISFDYNVASSDTLYLHLWGIDGTYDAFNQIVNYQALNGAIYWLNQDTSVEAYNLKDGAIPGTGSTSALVALSGSGTYNNSINIANLGVSGVTTVGDFEYYMLAFAKNEDGTAGTTTIDNLSFTSVPEPGTYALLAGLTGLVFVMLRRRR